MSAQSASALDSAATTPALLTTPLDALHRELGARMVPFAGYSMPVQYPSGLIAEHHHTRAAAGLFDVSHMGQLTLQGPLAAQAFETLMPMDVIDLPASKQRYGLLLSEEGTILDDLMFIKRPSAAGGEEIFVVVNGACKASDLAHIQARIGERCRVTPLPEQALLALQGPQAVTALSALASGVEGLVFMTGGFFTAQCPTRDGLAAVPIFVTRSGYTGEDGFEISVHQSQAEHLARALLAREEVKPIGLGARNSLRLEAGLCLYGNDIDQTTSPVEANLLWALQKVRRAGGARAGGYPGAERVQEQLNRLSTAPADGADLRLRVGLVALERIPVREHTELHDLQGTRIGEVCSGLLGPSVDRPIAMAYVQAKFAVKGQRVQAIVRGKAVPMEVTPMPFTPHRYYRG